MKSKKAIIRCPIHGSISISQKELVLVNSPFFQRLRYISQLGFTSFVFPGAVHTRFSHSLGVMHLAGRVYDQLTQNRYHTLEDHYSKEQLAYFRRILRFSALLHDVGHPPFSHAAESLLPDYSALDFPKHLKQNRTGQSTHEDFSHLMVYHLAHSASLLSMEEAEDVIGILSKNQQPSERMNDAAGNPMIYPLLCQLINGEIDVDRMDYLLRDSYYAGVPYGKFDLERLISSFSCCLEENLNRYLLAIDGEGVPSYEIFLLARIHMFYQIYFHKSLGAYRHYLKKAFQENEITLQIDGSLEEFLNLTETALLEEFRQKRDHKWSGRIFNRVPAKNLIRVQDGEEKKLDQLQVVKKLLEEKGIETIISYSSNQYSSQIQNRKNDQETILVIDEAFGSRTILPLAEKTALLGEVEKQIEITQLYVHREDYDQAIVAIQKQLRVGSKITQAFPISV
ncbi:MAG: HD domain-containing protein [Deltaproteobacteria bacterium]|nr:HD domain-containing protein [Deltaproteobacteria bacterium]